MRELRISSAECGLEAVRIVGDGPNDESDSLLADAGIGPESFFLLDATGRDLPP
jgi:hypothetical protein